MNRAQWIQFSPFRIPSTPSRASSLVTYPHRKGTPFSSRHRVSRKVSTYLVTHREESVTRAMSIQVKSFRTYSGKSPTSHKRKLFRYYTWYNNFDTPPEADFVLLIALYPNDERKRDRALETWW